jgi:hypothetical protein
LRADSGFAREELMKWCEEHQVDYVFGLARNSRLEALIREELAEAAVQSRDRGTPVRIFKELTYQTQESWSRARRVMGNAEHLPDKPNPRFAVTSYTIERMAAAPLYEELYCARGNMENRIKEQQLACSRIAPAVQPCVAISCGCGLPQWLMRCSTICATRVYAVLNSPAYRFQPFAAACSKSMLA